MNRKRYAICGVSNRGLWMFMDSILKTYHRQAELVGMLDKDRSRLDGCNRTYKLSLPAYAPDDFDRMVRETRPDVIVVTCHDAMHHHYVIQALKHDLDVIVEKPLTTDEAKCAAIVKAQARSRGRVRVTFNYRYTAATTKIRELIAAGRIGRVVSVDLNWTLDTWHGSSYFQRWNRLRGMSGGLSIHKACHHFDLVHWWIGQKVSEVHAHGALNFYGPGGVHNPLKKSQIGDGRTCPTCDVQAKCPYFMRWSRKEWRTGSTPVMFPQKYDGYSARQCIFDPRIDIEDTYAAVMRYDGGAFLNYSLNASTPYEGFRLGINGTGGRLDYQEFHDVGCLPFPDPGQQPVILYPMFGGRETIDVIRHEGGHGGGDPQLLDELFIGPDRNATVPRAAGLEDGIESVLTGVAVHRSANEGRTLSVDDMRKRVWGGRVPGTKPFRGNR